jgi:TonB family protein
VAFFVFTHRRRRHLAARLEQLLQEVPMSRMRFTSAAAILTLVIASASWASVSALPLQAPSQETPSQETSSQETLSQGTGAPQQPVKASDVDQKPRRVIKQVNAIYPQDAKEAKVQGDVELELRVAKDGTVAEVRVIKGIPQLDKAASEAAKQWTFEPATVDGKPVEVSCRMMIRFALK